jgi:hypothetical protein
VTSLSTKTITPSINAGGNTQGTSTASPNVDQNNITEVGQLATVAVNAATDAGTGNIIGAGFNGFAALVIAAELVEQNIRVMEAHHEIEKTINNETNDQLDADLARLREL